MGLLMFAGFIGVMVLTVAILVDIKSTKKERYILDISGTTPRGVERAKAKEVKEEEDKELDVINLLREIKRLSEPVIEFSDISRPSRAFASGDTYEFSTENLDISKTIKTQSLQLVNVKEYHCLTFFNWRLSREDYNNIFHSPFKRYAKGNIPKVISILKDNIQNPHYLGVVYKYEGTLNSVRTALYECRRVNGYIVEEVGSKALKVLSAFIDAVYEVEKVEREKSELDRQATNKGISGILDFELEYIEEMNNRRKYAEELTLACNKSKIIKNYKSFFIEIEPTIDEAIKEGGKSSVR